MSIKKQQKEWRGRSNNVEETIIGWVWDNRVKQVFIFDVAIQARARRVLDKTNDRVLRESRVNIKLSNG